MRRIMYALFAAALLAGCVSPGPAVRPSVSDRMYYKAYFYVGMNEYSTAIGVLTKLISLDKTYTDAYVLRAYALELDKRPEEACRDLLAALALDPRNPVIHYNLGNVYFELNDYAKAVEEYTVSISLNKDHAFSYLNRANAYILLGRLKDALSDYRRFMEMSDEQRENILKIIAILEKKA